MNQILVTEKLYVTPELKRKKKLYKFSFMVSIFLIIILCSVYIYAEYDKNKEAGISEDILAFLSKQDETIVSEYENALVVKITQDVVEQLDTINGEEIEFEQIQLENATSTYVAPNGKIYETIGSIKIPAINLNYPILSQTTDELMKVAPCKLHGANANEVGNLCIISHNYRRKNKLFSDVPDLKVGDIVEIQDLNQKTIEYEVYDIHTVLPDNTDDTTQKTKGKKEVTLITCTDDGKQRVIVKCKEKV